MKVSLYLNFDGNCADAFDFYKEVFQSEITCKMTWSQSPQKKKAKTEVSEKDGNKIMHMGLSLTKDTDLMGCDNPPEGYGCDDMDDDEKEYTVGNNMQITLEPDSKEHADNLLKALSSKGGKVIMPMSNTFWGAYFGMCRDAYGITWMFNFPSEEEKKEDENWNEIAWTDPPFFFSTEELEILK